MGHEKGIYRMMQSTFFFQRKKRKMATNANQTPLLTLFLLLNSNPDKTLDTSLQWYA